jgi:nitrous oxidase accessory protein
VKRNVFTENAFIDNTEQVGVQGTGDFSGNDWAAAGVGNYWSDFSGYDADRDGVGDIPYKLDDLYSEMADDHPELRFFTNTPAARAVDQAAVMFPVLRPRPKVEDPYPLIAMPQFEAPSGSDSVGGTSLLLVATAMLLLGLVIVMVGRSGTRRSRGSRAP